MSKVVVKVLSPFGRHVKGDVIGIDEGDAEARAKAGQVEEYKRDAASDDADETGKGAGEDPVKAGKAASDDAAKTGKSSGGDAAKADAGGYGKK